MFAFRALLVPLALLFAVGPIRAAAAQSPLASQQARSDVKLAQATSELGVLKGRWVRRDGGYAIDIISVDPSGKMDATYSNPKPISVSKAEVSAEAGALNIFLELRAPGYPGSTYTLTYDPKSDCLVGIYFHAVMQQKFGVIFQRAQ